MKRLLIIISLLLSVCVLCGAAYAADSESFILTGFKELSDPNWPYWKEVVILEEDETLTADMLPSHMIYDCEDGGYAIRISWDLNDTVLTDSGLHYVTGTPILPDDTVLADGFDGIATWPVFRMGDSVTLTVTPEPPKITDILISQNGDPASEICFNTPNHQYRVGNDGYIDISSDIKWQWDFSEVNTSTLGSYTITGTPVVPEWLSLSNNTSVSYTVYVLPTDRIEIYGDTGLVGNRLEIYWIYSSTSVTNAILEVKANNNQWVSCDKSWYEFHNSYSPAKLTLYPLNIPTGVEYTLRLRYTDVINSEEVERFTEPIILTVPANIKELIKNNFSIFMTQLGNGDRDGGDSNGSELPDYTQPAPQPEENTSPTPSNGSVSNPVNEVVTDTYSAISGLRLSHLIDSCDTVLFEKHGISVEIPSELLKALNLGDNELFEITILNPQKTAVQIEVTANGTPVENLSGTIVYLPWDAAEGTDLQCYDIHGSIIATPVYDRSSKTVSFEINSTGTYFITATNSKVTNEPKADEPVIAPEPSEQKNHTLLYVGIGIGAFLILFIAGTLLWRKRHHN